MTGTNMDWNDISKLDSSKVYLLPLKSFKTNMATRLELLEKNGYSPEEAINLLDNSVNDDICYCNPIFDNENMIYPLFGDIDYCPIERPKTIIKHLSEALEVAEEDIALTKNETTEKNSYHFVIRSAEGTIQEQKQFFENYNKNIPSIPIDTNIYKAGVFKCPNQLKEKEPNTRHRVVAGEMRDFLLMRYPGAKRIIFREKEEKKPISVEMLDSQPIENDNKLLEVKECLERLSQIPLHYEFKEWYKVGFSLIMHLGYGEEVFKLFLEWSQKDPNTNRICNETKMREVWNNWTKDFINKTYKREALGIRYLCRMAGIKRSRAKVEKEDTKDQSIEMQLLELVKDSDLMDNLKIKIDGDSKNIEFYLFNDTLGLWYRDRPEVERYIYNLALNAGITKLTKSNLKGAVDLLVNIDGLRDKTTDFDKKPYLLGFNNMIYDFRDKCFRKGNYGDYVSMTVGYDWREPTDEELSGVANVIKKIFPIEEERECALRIMATGLTGYNLQQFTTFYGTGRNGKGVINRLMFNLLGKDFSYNANSAILSEKQKTGGCPELSNMSKKRYIVFKEPDSRQHINNTIMKSLTGGDTVSARALYQATTEQVNNGTYLVEANELPKYASKMDNAEFQRLVNIPFRSEFGIVDSEIEDYENKIWVYKANGKIDNLEWYERHRYAFFKILSVYACEFCSSEVLKIALPKSIVEATNEYILYSNDITNWFNDTFERLEETKERSKILYGEYVFLKDIYEMFKVSDLYMNMTKIEKRKYNKKEVDNIIRKNQLLGKGNIIERGTFPDENGVKKEYYSPILINYRVRDSYLVSNNKGLSGLLLELDD